MKPEDRMYIAEHSRKGTFEKAMAGPDRYEKSECYLVGAIAVHFDAVNREWILSHAATGMGINPAFGSKLADAIRVARGIDSAIDWSLVKRTKTVGAVKGLTESAEARSRQHDAELPAHRCTPRCFTRDRRMTPAQETSEAGVAWRARSAARRMSMLKAGPHCRSMRRRQKNGLGRLVTIADRLRRPPRFGTPALLGTRPRGSR